MFRTKQKPSDNRDRLGRQRPASVGGARTVERAGNATVFSYHASRSARANSTGRIDPQATPAATATRSNQHSGLLRRTPVLIISGVVALLVIVNLVLTGTPQVRVGHDSAIPLRQPMAYQTKAMELFSASPLNKSKLTVNATKINAGMRAAFPELSRVTVSVPFIGSAPVVHVMPAAPVLLLNANGQLYALDATGKALLPANEVPNIEKLDLPVVVDGSGLSVTAGKPALPASNVRFITEVIGQLKQKNLTVTDINLPAGTSEMDVRVSGVGYIGKFNLQGDGRVEAGSYLAVKAQLEREHKVPGSYIDVRVEGRAYYK